jgi:hypothetical protein
MKLPYSDKNPHSAFTAQVDKPIWKGCLIAFLFLAIHFTLATIWFVIISN